MATAKSEVVNAPVTAMKMRTPSILPPNVTLDVELTGEHLVKLSVSKAETQLTKLADEAKALTRRLEKDIAASVESLNKAVTTNVEATLAPYTKALDTALGNLGSALHHATAVTPNHDQKNVTWRIDLEPRTQVGNVQRVGTIAVGSANYEKQFVEQCEAIATLRTQLADVQAKWQYYTQKLQNINSLERRASAALVEAQLKKTTEGQAILDSLTEALEADMNTIPLLS